MSSRVNRSSFDRLDDDLSQLVLSFLPFEDKFKLESTSKQFQRSVFEKQLKLIIDPKTRDRNSLNILAKRHEFVSIVGRRLKVMDLKAFETVLKKCPNLSIIDVQDIEFVNKKEVIDLVTKYATHLTEFLLDNNRWDSRLFTHFFDKFGPNLKAFDVKFFEKENLKTLLKFCPNLSKFKDLNSLSAIFNGNHILTKRISEMRFVFFRDDIELFGQFVITNKLSLKWLSVDFYSFNGPVLKEFGNHLAKLKNLRVFYLHLRQLDSNSSPLFARLLKQLAQSCNNLTKICININPLTVESYLTIIETLNQFTKVRKIDVFIMSSIFAFMSMEGTLLSSNVLKNCKQLTHLTLNNCNLSERFFEDIGTEMPQLKYLDIDQLQTLTDFTIDSLSRLPKIEKIILFAASEPNISESSTNRLYNSCRRLISIHLFRKFVYII